MKKISACLFFLLGFTACVSPQKKLPIISAKTDSKYQSSNDISISLRQLLPQETKDIFAQNFYDRYVIPFNICIDNDSDEPIEVKTVNIWSQLSVDEVNHYVKTPELNAIGYGSIGGTVMPLALHSVFRTGSYHNSDLQTPQVYMWSFIGAGIISGISTAVLVKNNNTVYKELRKYSIEGHVFESKKNDCATFYIDQTLNSYAMELAPAVDVAADTSQSYIEIHYMKSGKSTFFPILYK